MDYIYSPWRNMAKNHRASSQKPSCVFCEIAKSLNEQPHVLYKDETCFLVMNKYPYNSGHVLLVPFSHVPSPVDLDAQQWLRISVLMQQTTALLCEVLNTKHINIGMNVNDYAGASVGEHLHIHFVPRYKGDTNFMTAIFDSRVYPNDFEEIYKRLLEATPRFLKQ